MVTKDLSKFGQRELAIAGKLLSTLNTVRDISNLGDGIEVYMNTNSGYVFLSDEDYNTAMMNGHDLEDFISCPDCGHEAFKSEFNNEHAQECCKEYLDDIA